MAKKTWVQTKTTFDEFAEIIRDLVQQRIKTVKKNKQEFILANTEQELNNLETKLVNRYGNSFQLFIRINDKEERKIFFVSQEEYDDQIRTLDAQKVPAFLKANNYPIFYLENLDSSFNVE